MNILGIELRRANNLNNLLSDVDKVLASNDIAPKSGNISDKFRAETCVLALQKMFQGQRHFDICVIRECADIFNIVVPAERLRVYKAVHCVNWSEMEPSYRQTLTALILDDFREVLILAA